MYIEAGNTFEDSAAECNNTVSFRFKVQRHLTTDALPNHKGNTDEAAQQESAAEKNLTPPNFPGATGFSRSDANAVAPLHCNSLIAKLPTFSSNRCEIRVLWICLCFFLRRSYTE